MFDLLYNVVDAPVLLSLLNFSVQSRHLRGGRIFRLPFHRTNYGTFEPMNNMLAIFNEVYDLFDYHLNRSSFRTEVRLLASL